MTKKMVFRIFCILHQRKASVTEISLRKKKKNSQNSTPSYFIYYLPQRHTKHKNKQIIRENYIKMLEISQNSIKSSLDIIIFE